MVSGGLRECVEHPHAQAVQRVIGYGQNEQDFEWPEPELLVGGGRFVVSRRAAKELQGFKDVQREEIDHGDAADAMQQPGQHAGAAQIDRPALDG